MSIIGELLLTIVSILLAASSALLAGVFFAFSSFLMRALDKIDRAAGVAAMVSINRQVLNRSFLTLFFACAGLSCGLLLLLFTLAPPEHAAWSLGAGALLSLVGFFITAIKNVPLNEALKLEQESGSSPEASWRSYHPTWVHWNHWRCAAYFGSTVALLIGIR